MLMAVSDCASVMIRKQKTQATKDMFLKATEHYRMKQQLSEIME